MSDLSVGGSLVDGLKPGVSRSKRRGADLRTAIRHALQKTYRSEIASRTNSRIVPKTC